jgi:aspartate oxidase
MMTDRVGVVRSGEGLAAAMAELAIRREESRGGHWRSDHPVPVEAWRVRQTFTRSPDGGLDTGLLAVPTAEEARR